MPSSKTFFLFCEILCSEHGFEIEMVLEPDDEEVLPETVLQKSPILKNSPKKLKNTSKKRKKLARKSVTFSEKLMISEPASKVSKPKIPKSVSCPKCSRSFTTERSRDRHLKNNSCFSKFDGKSGALQREEIGQPQPDQTAEESFDMLRNESDDAQPKIPESLSCPKCSRIH